MKTLGIAVLAIAGLFLALSAGAIAGGYVVHKALAGAEGFRAEAQATFTDKDEVTVEFPALVRGRRINCVVVANTKRKVQSIFC